MNWSDAWSACADFADARSNALKQAAIHAALGQTQQAKDALFVASARNADAIAVIAPFVTAEAREWLASATVGEANRGRLTFTGARGETRGISLFAYSVDN